MLKKLFFFILLISILLMGCSNSTEDVIKSEDITQIQDVLRALQKKSSEDMEDEIYDLSKKIENLNRVVIEQQELITQLSKEIQKVIGESEIQNGKSHIQQYIDELNKPIIFDVDDPMGRFYYSDDMVLDGSYSSSKAIESYYKVNTFLRSFEKLSEKTKKYLSQEEIDDIGNLDGETQTLGLGNTPLNIIGGLYDQNYIIKKLDLELAIKKYQDGEIDKGILDAKREEYLDAKKEYERFINGASYAD